MLARLIGVTGYAKHGKDSTGKVLQKHFGYKRYAFADQLKEMALVLNPIIPNEPYADRLYTVVQDQGWDKAKENPEIRRFLQVLGTEAVRDFLGADAWVRALSKRMHEDDVFGVTADGVDLDPHTKIVITDVRFPNEADWVRKVGGSLWRIVRLNADGSVFDNGIGSDHPSEKYIAGLHVDRVLEAYTLGDLEKAVLESV